MPPPKKPRNGRVGKDNASCTRDRLSGINAGTRPYTNPSRRYPYPQPMTSLPKGRGIHHWNFPLFCFSSHYLLGSDKVDSHRRSSLREVSHARHAHRLPLSTHRGYFQLPTTNSLVQFEENTLNDLVGGTYLSKYLDLL
jgi:hypothetical protein